MHTQFQIAIIFIVLSSPAVAAQTVRATWYGHELAGNRTASGEMFNPNGLTTAPSIFAIRHLPPRGQSNDGSQRLRPCQRSRTLHERRVARSFIRRCAGHRHALDAKRDGREVLVSASAIVF